MFNALTSSQISYNKKHDALSHQVSVMSQELSKMEVQVGQLSKKLQSRPQRALPSQTEQNLRYESVKVITTLLSGKSYENNIYYDPHVDDYICPLFFYHFSWNLVYIMKIYMRMDPEGKKMYLPVFWSIVTIILYCGVIRRWIRQSIRRKCTYWRSIGRYIRKVENVPFRGSINGKKMYIPEDN
jgi:hypothetical protein